MVNPIRIASQWIARTVIDAVADDRFELLKQMVLRLTRMGHRRCVLPTSEGRIDGVVVRVVIVENVLCTLSTRVAVQFL